MSDELVTKEDFQRARVALDFASLNKLIMRDLTKTKDYNKVLKKYSRQDIITYMENPQKYEKQMRDLSTILFNKSPHYRRLIQYFSRMLPLHYIVEPHNVDWEKINPNTFKSQYKKVLQFVELMNIRHEFLKILNIAYREDVFYGYEHMTNDSYFIQPLNADYCSISSQEDGVYNFAFDFSYFQGNPEKLEMFPPEFKKKFNKYKKDPKLKFQELDADKTICIKVNEDFDFITPPFSSVFDSIFDIEDFKSLRKDKEEISNYKILIQRIPMRDKSENNNDFMVDFETVMLFHNKASQALPDQVGLISTPMEIKDISFEKDSADSDNVAKAERDAWSAAGVSQLLFNADKTTSIGLTKSIQADEVIAFGVLRQIERWINRRLKFFGKVQFRIKMLDISVFNQDEFSAKMLEAGNAGQPVKMMYAASIGLSPSSFIGMAVLENEILGLQDLLVTFPSAAHGSLDDANAEGGAPKKRTSKISDEGARARDKGGTSGTGGS